MAYNILLVDDSSVIRKVMKRTFGLTNIEIGQMLEAENGQQGLEMLRSNWVDLVFLDINMPIMNGVQMVEAMQADDALKNTPVVIVSTEGAAERIDHLKDLGIKSYLRKPVTPEQLVEITEQLLSGDKHE